MIAIMVLKCLTCILLHCFNDPFTVKLAQVHLVSVFVFFKDLVWCFHWFGFRKVKLCTKYCFSLLYAKIYPIGYGKMKRTPKTHFRFPIGYKLVSK